MPVLLTPEIKIVHPRILALKEQLDRVIVEHDAVKVRLILAILAGQHVLIESTPGLGKTMLVKTLQNSISGTTSARVQGTPDLTPNSVLGFEVYDPKNAEFVTRTGPLIGAHFLLYDEANRAAPRTNSATLQAMQEKQVTIGGRTYNLEDLFLVMATINPIEQEGTYTLPEAMLDRFCFKLEMKNISRAGEIELLRRTDVHQQGAMSLLETPPVTGAEMLEFRREVGKIAANVPDEIRGYVIDCCRATRPADEGGTLEELDKQSSSTFAHEIRYGVSPRAGISVLHTAAALAFISGRIYVTVDDVKAVIPDCFRHRIILNTVPQPGDTTVQDLIATILHAEVGVHLIKAK